MTRPCTGVRGDHPSTCASCRIRPVALFGLVPEARLPNVAAVRSRTVQRLTGQPMPEPMFTLYDGWAVSWMVTTDGYRRVLDIHLPGDLVEQPAPQGGVVALTPATYCVLAPERFARLVREEPDLAAAYVLRLQEARARLWEQLAGPVRQSAQTRVARTLLDLHRRLVARGLMAEAPVAVPVSQALLAEAAGLSHEQVNRCLRALERGGVALLARGVFQVLDQARLAELAGFSPAAPRTALPEGRR